MTDPIETDEAASLSAFSICIPTFNRAHLLGLCLEHLAGFRGDGFELIVGDNASTDDTPAVVQRYAGRFKNLSYLRHKENLGFARNMDALLRRARRSYVYILSDDDFVFEDALLLVSRIMSARPEVVAVVGKYLSCTTLDSSTGVDYSTAVGTVLEKDQHQSLIDHFTICDGHPFIRREVFQRHCAYWDRTVGLIPLFFRLLSFGNVILVDKPFFQHLTNSDSLSGSMSEAWFLDMCHADFELSLTGGLDPAHRARLGLARDKLLQLVYFQAARMAFNRQRHLTQWLFLRRLDAVGAAGADLLVKAEHAFMHDFLSARLVQIIDDGCFEEVRYAPRGLAALLVPELKLRLPDVVFFAELPAGALEAARPCLSLVDEAVGEPNRFSMALQDLFSQMKLSSYVGTLVAEQGRVTVRYNDPATAHLLSMPTRSFEVMRAKYSADSQHTA